MARTVNPAQHAARRLQIIDAALTCFAAHGYEGTTTAAICRTAGIGSGTFFHYFPAKADVLIAILELGTRGTREWFERQAGRDDGLAVVRDWVAHTADELTDERVPGFVRAVGAVLSQPAIAAALTADDASQREGLRPWIALARRQGTIRADLSERQAVAWVMVLVDGFVGRVATEPDFLAAAEKPVLLDAVDRLLAPSGTEEAAAHRLRRGRP